MARKIPVYFLFVILAKMAVATHSFAQTPSPGTSAASEAQKNTLPKPVGYVNDFEGILTVEQIKELTAILKQHEQKTTNQIAIVTLPSLNPYTTIDEYSLDLANTWKLGQRGKDNGILIALAAGLGKIRIQNGYGIEARLTDAETKKIIDETIIPEFRNKNYYEGLRKGLAAILKELN